MGDSLGAHNSRHTRGCRFSEIENVLRRRVAPVCLSSYRARLVVYFKEIAVVRTDVRTYGKYNCLAIVQ